MNHTSIKWQLPFLVLLIVGTVLILRKQAPYQTDQGLVFGTVYKITYQSKVSLKDNIEAELQRVDQSLSPFNPASVITRINNNTDLTPDSLFLHVFRLSKTVSQATHGAFDITVAPLVNAWGFGFKTGNDVTPATIDSLLLLVGIDQVEVDADGTITKADPRILLDCSAIAKGFGVDQVARLLDRKGVRNYMVDIGGEVVVKGENAQQGKWRIGVNKPIDDSLSVNQELQDILEITDAGMATSGNYRNFYYRDGKKYAHTIDPRTGYPVQHNLLSSTVIAADCATADAYATSFMVLGLDSAKAICARHPELEAYFIYSRPDSTNGIYFTEGMKKYLRR